MLRRAQSRGVVREDFIGLGWRRRPRVDGQIAKILIGGIEMSNTMKSAAAGVTQGIAEATGAITEAAEHMAGTLKSLKDTAGHVMEASESLRAADASLRAALGVDLSNGGPKLDKA